MYDLKDQGEEGWEFSLTYEGKDYVYFMRYPTTEETVEAQKIGEDNQKALKFMLGFSRPVTEGAPTLDKVIAKKNIKFLSRFVDMVKKEWGGE